MVTTSFTATINSPEWFLGIDAFLESFSALVVLLVFIAAYKIYLFTGERKYRYFSWAFGLLTLSFATKAAVNFILRHGYRFPTLVSTIDLSALFILGYMAHIFLALMAYILLVTLTLKIKDKKTVMLFMAMTLIPLYFSSSYYLSFYALSFIMLGFVTWHYKGNWCQYKKTGCLLVFIAFLLLTLSQLQFLLNIFMPELYVTAYVTKILGFAAMLAALIKVFR